MPKTKLETVKNQHCPLPGGGMQQHCLCPHFRYMLYLKCPTQQYQITVPPFPPKRVSIFFNFPSALPFTARPPPSPLSSTFHRCSRFCHWLDKPQHLLSSQKAVQEFALRQARDHTLSQGSWWRRWGRSLLHYMGPCSLLNSKCNPNSVRIKAWVKSTVHEKEKILCLMPRWFKT